MQGRLFLIGGPVIILKLDPNIIKGSKGNYFEIITHTITTICNFKILKRIETTR